MAEALPASPGLRWQRRTGFSAVTLRHSVDDVRARLALEAAGLPCCSTPGRIAGDGPWLAWRSPGECLGLSFDPTPLHLAWAALAPGRCDTAVVLDLSHALALYELHGPGLDDWLARLVDASAIPRQPGLATRCRLIEVTVDLWRLAPERLWLLADRHLAPWVAQWLDYAQAGATSGPSAQRRFVS